MASTRQQAGIPPYPELRSITLEAMRGVSLPASNDEINSAVADALNLTSHQRSVLHVNSNQTELAYCVAWARTALRVGGAVQNAGRALWTLTEEGWSITAETVNQRYEAHLAERAAARRESVDDMDGADSADLPQDLEELDWRGELLDRLMNMSPQGFEHLSGALLRAAGFHGVTVTRQSSDGGIDAFAVYRPQGLISFRTTVQCKRWSGGIGSDRVQAFQGASMGKADRGILITTGHFTPAAETQAQAPGAFPVDLVDGDALCELLRENSLGVRTVERKVEDITVDQAYFAQFEDSQ